MLVLKVTSVMFRGSGGTLASLALSAQREAGMEMTPAGDHLTFHIVIEFLFMMMGGAKAATH